MAKLKMIALLVLLSSFAAPLFAATTDPAGGGAAATKTAAAPSGAPTGDWTVIGVDAGTGDLTLDMNGAKRSVRGNPTTAGIKAGDKVGVNPDGTITKK
ncbi:MAG TPA: hypothetical protein VL404_09925 [Candidatus Eisenbacteria bacterium]|nr:hypothetical protein [Candidatus Eisenbacteria bacterium]